MTSTQTSPAEAPPPVDLRPHVVAYLANNLRTNGYEHHARTMEALAELRAAGEPLFWYRPCRDGLYEGPHHNNSNMGKMLRDEKPEEWVPLYAAPQASAEAAPLAQYSYQTLFDAISAATWTVASGDIEVSVQAFRDALKSTPAATVSTELPEIPFGPAFIDAYRKHYIAWGEQCFAAGAALTKNYIDSLPPTPIRAGTTGDAIVSTDADGMLLVHPSSREPRS